MPKARFNPLLFVLVGLVRIYRWGIGPFLIPSCRYAPSCSEYALESLTRFGAARGTYLAAHRILRCHPWGGSGYDPVPDSGRPQGPLINKQRQA